MSSQNIPILMYHCINDCPNSNPLGFLAYSSDVFRTQLTYFKRNKFELITLQQLAEIANQPQLTRRYAVLTFDDGFWDNYAVAADILEQFKVKASIFVNPEFVAVQTPRAKNSSSSWGQLNLGELQELEKSGFDIQSHTMTHNFEFISDKLIDIYTPEKFNRYYWLSWKLFKSKKPVWCECADELAHSIPAGFPIFEYGRAISSPRFWPSQEFIEKAVAVYRQYGQKALEQLQKVPDKGSFETKQQWLERVRYELFESKHFLESNLNKKVEYVCFPGGSYNPTVLEIAEQCGYRFYMASSREEHKDNNLEALKRGISSGRLTALSRICFTKNYPQMFSHPLFTYLNCKITVGSFMGNSTSRCALNVLKKIRNIITK